MVNRDFLLDLIERAHHLITQQGLTFCLILVFLGYQISGRKDELGRNAAQNTAVTLLIFGANIVAVGWFVADINRFFQGLYGTLGIPRLPADTWDALPYWLVCILALVAKDFADYWTHRIMHTRWGWPTHAAHHSDTHVNAFTGYRVHFLESIVMNLTYIVLLTWLQMPQALPVVILFAAIHVKYVHMNLTWDHGPLKLLIASPAFHRWHHADLPEAYGKNLANVMPIWDWLFGTWYYPHACPDDAPMGALKTGVADKNPVAIYAYPFLEWGRLIRGAVTGKPHHQTPLEDAAPAAKGTPDAPRGIPAE